FRGGPSETVGDQQVLMPTAAFRDYLHTFEGMFRMAMGAQSGNDGGGYGQRSSWEQRGSFRGQGSGLTRGRGEYSNMGARYGNRDESRSRQAFTRTPNHGTNSGSTQTSSTLSLQDRIGDSNASHKKNRRSKCGGKKSKDTEVPEAPETTENAYDGMEIDAGDQAEEDDVREGYADEDETTRKARQDAEY
ncbi:hypothetical protein V5O48_007837, partial [Marasmius crinis-equi]